MPLRPPSQKSASSEELSTKKEEKKRRSVEIEEVLGEYGLERVNGQRLCDLTEEDAPRAPTSRLDPPIPMFTKGKMKGKCSVEMEQVLGETSLRLAI